MPRTEHGAPQEEPEQRLRYESGQFLSALQVIRIRPRQRVERLRRRIDGKARMRNVDHRQLQPIVRLDVEDAWHSAQLGYRVSHGFRRPVQQKLQRAQKLPRDREVDLTWKTISWGANTTRPRILRGDAQNFENILPITMRPRFWTLAAVALTTCSALTMAISTAGRSAQASSAEIGRGVPGTIHVDAAARKGPLASDLALLRRRRAELRLHARTARS